MDVLGGAATFRASLQPVAERLDLLHGVPVDRERITIGNDDQTETA